MTNYKNSWKDSVFAFEMQLKVNKKELIQKPPHWDELLFSLSILQKQKDHLSLLDVGCGCGAIYELIKNTGVKYYGIDYSDKAIQLAKKTWGYDHFYVMDYEKINIKTDILYQNGFVDVMENGDEVFEKLLSLRYPYVISQRMELTDKPSFSETYTAYDIKTYKFYHNRENLYDLVHKYNYDIVHEKTLATGLHLCLSLTA